MAEDRQAGETETSSDTIPASIAARLRREILNGDLPPGTALKERDHAERLGISRTPLREAVRILAQEGLVTLRPLRSPVVANPTLQEVRDELAVLRALELLSGALACANATEDEIARVARLAAWVDGQYHSGDKIDVFDVDMEMHRAIVEASHNAALIRTHAEYLGRLWRVRFLSAQLRLENNKTLADHAGMVEALQRRDEVALQQHIGAHVDSILANVEDHFSKGC